jgi:DNA-binding PadR family transcriptional regulator
MSHTLGGSRKRKAKKSYTLSPESVAFLERLRRKRRAPSTSSILEEILQAARRRQQRAAVDRAVTEYYGFLSDAEAEEQLQWGRFAWREFPDEGA